MSTTEEAQDVPVMSPTPTEETAPPVPLARKRPRLDMAAALGGGERKRGKSMFGVLLNTLNKAKAEDKERNASEAAKKRQLIDQKLRMKLRKETDSVRRAEEAKKEKLTANRKEEELQLQDSIHKLRRIRLPQLSNFLLTSDVIVDDEMDTTDSTPKDTYLAFAPRSHPPPLYYLPKVLTPAQETFLSKRKQKCKEQAEQDWDSFSKERKTGIDEILSLRQKAAEEDRKKLENGDNGDDRDDEPASAVDDRDDGDTRPKGGDGMDVDEVNKESDKKDERIAADDGDALEY